VTADAALLRRERLVLDTAGNDEDLTGPQVDLRLIPQPDRQLAVDDQEDLVGVGMLVPHELALRLRHLEMPVVGLGDDPGRPVLTQLGQLLGKVDGDSGRGHEDSS
jgi:hypothetical protein